jgi:hypothetical protein
MRNYFLYQDDLFLICESPQLCASGLSSRSPILVLTKQDYKKAVNLFQQKDHYPIYNFIFMFENLSVIQMAQMGGLEICVHFQLNNPYIGTVGTIPIAVWYSTYGFLRYSTV